MIVGGQPQRPVAAHVDAVDRVKRFGPRNVVLQHIPIPDADFACLGGEAPGLLKLSQDSPNEPPIITLIEYGPDCLEERKDVSCDELLPHLSNELVTWINIDGLGDLSVLRILGERFNLHPLALEDVLDTNQRPKAEQYDDYLFIVAKMLYLDKDKEIGGEQVSMFLGKTFLITLQEEPERDVFEPIRARIRSEVGRVRNAGADYLPYALLDSIIDH